MKLNLGAGYRRIPGFVNIDRNPECSPDLICDICEGLPFADGSVSVVRAFDFLEHVPLGKTVSVIEEIWRVLELGGEFESMTPSTDGRGAFQDPTHLSFWNRNSWLYWCEPTHWGQYGFKAKFQGRVKDIVTNEALHIIHTHAMLRKVAL